MKIHMMIFVHTPEGTDAVWLQKTFESNIRPVVGDIIDDPSFSPQFHNGYEVVKVTLNYEHKECWVSLAPLVLELTEIPVADYIEQLQENGWRKVDVCGEN